MMHVRNDCLSQCEEQKKVSDTEKKRENDEKRYRMVSDENSIYEYDLKCADEKQAWHMTEE